MDSSKALLIAIAAFAVTATGASAYSLGPEIFNRAGLTDDQIEAIEEAQGLRASGDFASARDVLMGAGITEKELLSIRQATRDLHEDMRKALEDDDYEAFKKAVADMPLGDIITSKEDFEQFREAHELRLAGEWKEAEDILDELGVEQGAKGWGRRHGPMMMFDLTDDQRDALQVARQANDRATIQAIYDEAGCGGGMWRNYPR